MFGSATHSRYVPAGLRYRNVDVMTRVDGASPHGLVEILYEEMLTRMASLRAALVNGDLARRSENQSRVLAILAALDSGLDHDRGGDVAPLLATVYTEAHRLVVAATQQGNVELLDSARTIIADIAGAWSQIR